MIYQIHAEKLTALVKAGKTRKEISRELGVGYTTVIAFCAKLGLSPVRQRKGPKRRATP